MAAVGSMSERRRLAPPALVIFACPPFRTAVFALLVPALALLLVTAAGAAPRAADEIVADSCISVGLLPTPPPQVRPGETVCLKVPVTNCGDIAIPAGRTTMTIGDFVPALPGGKPIPCGSCGESLILKQALPIGATDSLPVCVSVAAGCFCGRYCAPLTIAAGAGVRSQEVVDEICFVVNGCADRAIAFSHNPVRYTQCQSVDIATTATGPVTIKIYTIAGLLVRTLVRDEALNGVPATWDFKNDDGDLVASGLYVVSTDVGGTIHREKLLFVK